jgi:Ice-binding-like
MDGRVISSATQTSEGDSKMKRTYFRLLGAFVGFAAFLFGPFPALAQVAVAPNLKSAAPYAVLGTNAIPIIGTVTCTNTLGLGIGINGQVGTTFPGGITNTGCTITGPIDAPVAGSVVTDFNAAFASVDGLNPVCTAVIPIVTTTLAPGVYCSAAGTTIGAGVILTLNGNASDVWVFRVGTGGPGALTLTSAQVVMGGAAQACNVYWKTSAGMTVTDSASFVGTVLSGAAAVMTRTKWVGRMMATADVTLTNPEPMTFAGCAAPASITVIKDFIPDNGATVPVALICTSGTVTATPLNAAEGAPAVFTVTGALAGATCTATETTVPAGYTANQAGCVGVPLNGSCTITNTLIPPTATLTLRKTWAVNSIAGNTATVTSIGFPTNASSGLSTALLAGNTTTGGSVTVSAGDTGTISEAFGVGAAANYTATLACTGNNTPLAASTLTVNAADVAIVCTETNTLIPCPVITLTPAKLPLITVGTAYSQTITVVGGGSRAYDFTPTAGALPAGLALTGATNTSVNITGTPTTAGAFSFQITATDRLNPSCFANITYAAAAVTPVGGPTLDSLGLTILILLLAVAGVFLVNRFTV